MENSLTVIQVCVAEINSCSFRRCNLFGCTPCYDVGRVNRICGSKGGAIALLILGGILTPLTFIFASVITFCPHMLPQRPTAEQKAELKRQKLEQKEIDKENKLMKKKKKMEKKEAPSTAPSTAEAPAPGV